ncbi:DUF2157 domain-containing protein [Chitinilyticum aquatile]|uniref:DUF2157 domain-containing protein n=1 Tax=Chitinilyticum aquatile TaxID=362520 RepID=UPI0003F69EAA|nr:DUF2157 domain-containing protein [Chitinilyticum aquatile]
MQASDLSKNELAVLEGHLRQGEFLADARASGALPDAQRWQAWLWQLPALAGLLCVLSGIIMVFAANWWTWPALLRVGVAEALWLLAVAGWWCWREKAAGVWLAFAIVVLTGAWLAVIGQTYQTGADEWELFAIWALLALPWALWARHEPVWGLWLLIASVAVVLFNNTTGGWRGRWPEYGLWPLHLIWLATCAWVMFRSVRRGVFAHGVVLIASFVVAIPAWLAVLDLRLDPDFMAASQQLLVIHPWLAALIWLLLNLAGAWHFRRQGPLLWLACPVYSLWVGFLIAFGRMLGDFSGLGMLLLALIAVGSFAAVGIWLRKAAAERREYAHD